MEAEELCKLHTTRLVDAVPVIHTYMHMHTHNGYSRASTHVHKVHHHTDISLARSFLSPDEMPEELLGMMEEMMMGGGGPGMYFEMGSDDDSGTPALPSVRAIP